jgi:glycosyltransferase involved in cell wall biosynthesis
MRVILATTAPETGGVSRHLFDLAGGLRQRGDEVVVSSRGDAPVVIAGARERGLRWVPIQRSVSVGADVWHLHLHNTLDTRALPLLWARRTLSRGAVVLTEHLPRVPRTDPAFPVNPSAPRGRPRPGAAQLKPLLKRAEYAAADAIISVSRSSAQFIARRWGARATVIHNGVPVPVEAPQPRSGAVVRVAGIAALHWLKGFDVLLDAAALATEPWSVRIVGDGVERGRLEAQARRLNGSRQVEFTGWLKGASEAALDADIVCAPSRAESFSYVVLEAMACARPVVASAVDGATEAVADGECGVLVAPGDPHALAAAIDALAVDRATRQRMGAAAHARVRAGFEASRMVDETVELYERARAGFEASRMVDETVELYEHARAGPRE